MTPAPLPVQFWILAVILHFALPGNCQQTAQAQETASKTLDASAGNAASQKQNQNLLPFDGSIAPSIQIGGESSLQQLEGYHIGYMRATVPLKSRLEAREHFTTKGLFRERFLCFEAETGDITDVDFSNPGFARIKVGLSGIRPLGLRSFLVWSTEVWFAESYFVFGDSHALPRIGIRTHGAIGYAHTMESNRVWFGGAYLGYDDGMWLPVPWFGFQKEKQNGGRVRLLLPREFVYERRIPKDGKLNTAQWIWSTEIRWSMDRYGITPSNYLTPGGFNIPTRANQTLWELRFGGWVGRRIGNHPYWIQCRGGWIPYRRQLYSVAPGSLQDDDPRILNRLERDEPEWIWDAFSTRSRPWIRRTRPYLEIRLVAESSKTIRSLAQPMAP